ncbi:HBL014Cp [Eremothecium sinecaudum]|uniref:HBL014Cp n=1 Tax=Eremothecium sinecaudum TaxID=45286 RepID=A0A109UWK0_9SACH|nr:HBL014Cp [Eremothecium sinecaudum]AMD18888.1 HBL014Cp [Eremothecium sinecaudum]
MIDAILSVSDPNEISVKRIRAALQELFAVELHNEKKEIKVLILDRFHRLQDKQAKTLSKEELTKRDAELASKLAKEGNTRQKRTRKKEVAEKPRKKRRAANNENPNSFHLRNVILSSDLQKFLGKEQLPRTQVVKAVWDYIKQHNLQNPEDRREILCDETMQPIFGKKVTMFSMNKVLSKHLFNPSDVANNSAQQEKNTSVEELSVDDNAVDEELNESEDFEVSEGD